MKALLRDTRVQRLLLANITGSIGSGVTIIAVPWLLIHRQLGSPAAKAVVRGPVQNCSIGTSRCPATDLIPTVAE